jgi:8-oxo-dGTP diphosphatase
MNTTSTSKRSYPQTPLLGASACIFDRSKVLLVLGARPPKQDLWSLPGGLVEVGETLQKAAVRELLEETGLSADILGLADWIEVIERHDGIIQYHFVIAMFVGRFSLGEIKAGDDASDARWFDLSELSRLPMTKGTADVIHKAYQDWIEGKS